MHRQKRQRLAIGLTGALMAGTLLVGAVSVAADDSDVPEPRDVNVGMEATGMAIPKVGTSLYNAAPAAAPTTAATVEIAVPTTVQDRDDHAPDASEA